MSTHKIAARLVELCRRGEFKTAHTELFAADAVSIENNSPPEKWIRGHDGLAGKARMFDETFEVHGHGASEPIVAGPFFSSAMTAEVTNRKSGERMKLEEIGLYEVKDGKIVREQFFYPEMG